MSDWSAVYLDGTLGTGPGFAAAGYAAFSLAMASGASSATVCPNTSAPSGSSRRAAL
jgi:hypothetical protein